MGITQVVSDQVGGQGSLHFPAEGISLPSVQSVILGA